jgi:ankyrin repeat protein
MHITTTLALALVIANTQAFAKADAKNDWLSAVTARDTTRIGQLIPSTQDINQQTKKGLTALMAAAARGDNLVVRQLLIDHAKPNMTNNRGGTALMYSAALNHQKTVTLLIESGAEINKRADNGWTALTLAAAKGNNVIVEKLLSAGADPNIPDVYGWTALMRAIEHDRNKSIALIAQHPATKINRINSSGQSALHIAASINQCDTVKLLTGVGADIQLKDFREKEPLLGSRCSL